MKQHNWDILYYKYLTDALTPEEFKDFWSYLQLPENKGRLEGEIELLLSNERLHQLGEQVQVDRAWQNMRRELYNDEQPIVFHAKPFYKWVWAAAILFVALGTGIYIWLRQPPAAAITQVAPINAQKSNETRTPILTLSDGSILPLIDSNASVLTLQNGNTVILENNKLTYAASNMSDSLEYNTLTTPKGRQFQLQLPDGTLVWLNAASSIRYPTNFSGKNRQVYVNGELYFDVTTDKKRPFKVFINNTLELNVLGTSFNINAYSGEALEQITLINGAVKVKEHILKPGQLFANNTISLANIEQVTAWKNGLFNFEGADIRSIMQQLARWYDIEVVYPLKLPKIAFKGAMERGLKLEQVLKLLKENGINCTLENKTLFIH